MAVASVPLRLAITVATAADHPALGAAFREMLADGELDERMAVMVGLSKLERSCPVALARPLVWRLTPRWVGYSTL